MNEEKDILTSLGIFFLLILCLGSIAEVAMLVYAYTHADKVECNWLWCTFTFGETISIGNSYSNITSILTSTSTCSVNGRPINCSEVDKEMERFR